MKKMILLAIVALLVKSSFSQQTTSSYSLTQEDYLKKSKQQKRVATILFVSGAAVTVVGTAMWLSQFNHLFTDWNEYNDKKLNTGASLAVVGGTMILASIPFYISAGKNKRLALSLSLKNQPVQQLQQNSLVLRNTPSLTLKFSL